MARVKALSFVLVRCMWESRLMVNLRSPKPTLPVRVRLFPFGSLALSSVFSAFRVYVGLV